MKTNYDLMISELIEVIAKHENALCDIPIGLTFVLAPDGCQVIKEWDFEHGKYCGKLSKTDRVVLYDNSIEATAWGEPNVLIDAV